MNRRRALGITATTAVGFALSPARIFAQVSSPGPQMSALSAYMSAAGTRPLPAEAAEHAKHHLLDTLASMISGSALLPGQAAQRYIRTHGGKGAATIAGTLLTAAPADAALANGVMAHADETDDSHNTSRSHPGCAVVPAALAVGEELGIDGTRLLRAVTLGYDIGTRVVMAMGGAAFSYESSLATHSIAGTFCAAAAAACAAGLDARQMRWVLDYTAQQSSGIVAWRRDTDHIEKAFVFGGMPARNGVTAALVVRTGWNGVDDIFSGSDNFFLAYAPKAQPERLVEKLGERYEIVQTDIKKWTVGSPIQGPLTPCRRSGDVSSRSSAKDPEREPHNRRHPRRHHRARAKGVSDTDDPSCRSQRVRCGPPPARGADRRRDGVTPEDAELDLLEAAFLN
jgi:2-methylcitrate dehydratase PrpD